MRQGIFYEPANQSQSISKLDILKITRYISDIEIKTVLKYATQ